MNDHDLHDGRRDAGRNAQSGFTLLEVLVSSVILSGILLISFRLIGGAQGQYATSSLNIVEETRAEDLLRRIIDRIRNGGIDTITNGTGTALADGTKSSNGMRVQLVTGYEDGPVFGETVGYRAVQDPDDADDDKDNDNDGRTDEMVLYYDHWDAGPVGTAESVILAEGISGITVARSGNTLTVTISLSRWDNVNSRTLVTSLSQTLLLRN